MVVVKKEILVFYSPLVKRIKKPRIEMEARPGL